MIVLARLFLPQKSFESCRCGRMSLFLFLVALLVLLLCPTRGLRTLQLRFGWTTGGRSGTGWLRQFPASKPFPGCSPSLSSDQVMSRYRAVLLWASPQQNHRREQIYKRRGKDDRADGRRDTNINNSTSISSSKNAPLLSLPENINYDRLVMDLKDFAYKQRQGAPNSRYALIYPQANPNQATINSSRDSVRVRMEELPLILLQGLNQLTVNQLSDLVWSLGALAKLDRPSAVQNGQMTKDLVFSAVVQFASLQEVFFSSLTVQQRIAASLETSKLLVGLARLGLSWQALSLHSPNSSSAYSLLPNTTAFAAALRNEEERQSSLVMLQSYLVPTILRSLQFARAQGLSNTMHSLAKMGATAQSLPPSLFKIITKKIADPKIYLSFNDQSLSNTLWALQRMGYTYNDLGKEVQDAIAVALSKVCLKIHPQAAGNILYSLGKLEIYDSVQSSSSLPTNFQVALELAIRNSAGKCRDTDIIQLLQGMALLRMRWEDLAPSTKETLCVPIYNIAIRWGTVDGPKSAVEIGTTLYHLSKLQVSWKSLPPTFRAMVIIGVIAITDFELLSPDMDQRKSDAKLRSSVENGRNARPSLAIQPGDRSRTIDEWIMQANIDNEICEDPEDVSEETSGKARQYLISKIMKIVNRDDPQRLLLLEKAVDVDKIESTNSDTIDKMEDNESSISAVKQIVGAIVSEDRNRISGKDISDAVRAANTYEEILWKLENMARPSFSAPSENSIRKNDDFFEIYGVSKGFDGEKTGVSDFRIESSDASAMQYDWKDAKRISPLEYSSADSVELSLGDEFKKEYARALASIIYSLSQFEFLQVVDIFPFEALNSLYYALAKYSSFFTGQGLAMTVISLGKLHMRWDSIVPPAVRSALIKSFQEFLINDHYDLSTKEENSIQTVANTLKGLAEMGCTFSDVDKPVQTSLLIWLDGVYSLQKSGTMFDASTEEFPIYISGTFGRHVVELLSSIVWFGVPFVHISDFLRFKLCAKSLHMLRYAPRDFSNSQEQIRYSNGNFEAIVKGLDTGKYKLVKQEEDSVKVEFVPEENDNNYMKLFVRDLILCLREFSEIGIDFDYLRRFTMVSAMSEHHPLGPVERFVGENITSMRYWNYYRFRASEDKGVELTIADEYSRSFYAENGVIRVFKSILQTKKLSYTAQGIGMLLYSLANLGFFWHFFPVTLRQLILAKLQETLSSPTRGAVSSQTIGILFYSLGKLKLRWQELEYLVRMPDDGKLQSLSEMFGELVHNLIDGKAQDVLNIFYGLKEMDASWSQIPSSVKSILRQFISTEIKELSPRSFLLVLSTFNSLYKVQNDCASWDEDNIEADNTEFYRISRLVLNEAANVQFEEDFGMKEVFARELENLRSTLGKL